VADTMFAGSAFHVLTTRYQMKYYICRTSRLLIVLCKRIWN